MGLKAVYIIRHAEKPAMDRDRHLSEKGQERALALANHQSVLFEKLDYLIAAKSSSRSARPLETITPLSQILHLDILSCYGNRNFKTLIRKLLNGSETKSAKSILLCWHHELIPCIARALGAKSVPRKWAPEVFDRIWFLSYTRNGSVRFYNLPQHLLYGDSLN
jgi:phosphohistidine phosphatase SixA